MYRKADEKIVSRDDARTICAGYRTEGTKIVFTNGCFDILHRGHIEYLQRARDLGDKLVIGLNSDFSVKGLKSSGRPVNDEDDRAHLLGSLEFVDLITLFDEETPADLIASLRPHVLVKGAEYKVEQIAGHDTVLANGGEVITVEMVPGKSTTGLIEKIKNIIE